MKRLINFSGPCIHGRVGGTHTQKRERDAPACTPTSLVYTWPVGYAERRTVSQRSPSASYHALLSSLSRPPIVRSVPFRSISFRVFILRVAPIPAVIANASNKSTLSFDGSVPRGRDRTLTRRKRSPLLIVPLYS